MCLSMKSKRDAERQCENVICDKVEEGTEMLPAFKVHLYSYQRDDLIFVLFAHTLSPEDASARTSETICYLSL